MKVIFLNRFFYPDHSATSQMLADLAFGLAKHGVEIEVITSRQRYDAADARLPAREHANDVIVHRIWTSRFGRHNLVGRSVDYVTFYLAASWRLLRVARPGDVVVTKTDPPMLSVLTAPTARLRRAKVVNWLQDIFPEVAEELGFRGRASRLGFGVLRFLRNRSLRTADMNVVVGARMAARLATLGVASKRVQVVPNWADGNMIVPIPPSANRLRQEWALNGQIVVGYSGNLGRAHEIATLIDAIGEVELMALPRVPVAWLFIGGGRLYQDLQTAVARSRFSRVQFRPYQPREQLAHSLSAADVHLVSLRPELEGLIVPSKIYGIAAAGRPTIFIGDAEGEVAQLIARHECGRTVAIGDSVALANAIGELARDAVGRAGMGERARVAFDTEFNKELAIARWQAVLASVAGGSITPAGEGRVTSPSTK